MRPKLLDGLSGPVWALAVLCVVCCIVGCSTGGNSLLSGKVTYAGQSVEEGAIRLTPKGETTGPGGSAKIAGGSYEITDLEAGTYAVSITGTRPATAAEAAQMEREEAAERDEEDEEDEEDGGPSQPKERRVQYIPEKYNMSTTLEVEVGPGENSKDFDLTP
jgi:hypothetical protein